MSIIPRINSTCFRKDEHDLELKRFDKQFTCDGCKQLGSGPRYRCDRCGYELHDECMFPKATISHEFFGSSIFKFFDEPQIRPCGKRYCKDDHGRCCDACGKDILGFNYHCVAKGWDLHPLCSNLEKNLPINDTIFELHNKVLSRCIWCKEKRISAAGVKNIPGWSYISRCGDFHFHVHCLMEMLHGKGNLALQKIDLQHLAKSKNKDKRGVTAAFWSTVKIFLKTIISILLGDPTTLFASAFVELISNR